MTGIVYPGCNLRPCFAIKVELFQVGDNVYLDYIDVWADNSRSEPVRLRPELRGSQVQLRDISANSNGGEFPEVLIGKPSTKGGPKP